MTIYDPRWHVHRAGATRASATLMLAYAQQLFGPDSLLEIGCGHGGWSQVALELGISDVLGVDGEWTDRTQLLIPEGAFRVHDLATPLDLGRTFDLVLTLEVAEHVHPGAADTFVDTCTRHAPLVMFGAAVPLQIGFRHVNEQWPSWWRAKFAVRGYRCFDLIRPRFWAQSEIPYFYRQNTFIFIDEAQPHLIEMAERQLSTLRDEILPLDAVHPEKFLEVASYESISLRRLLPKFPKAVTRMLRWKMSEARPPVLPSRSAVGRRNAKTGP